RRRSASRSRSAASRSVTRTCSTSTCCADVTSAGVRRHPGDRAAPASRTSRRARGFSREGPPMAVVDSTQTGATPAAGSENTRFIILISLVATIGGFLFGYDSGVINGTVDGLTAAFKSDAAVTGFNVASMLLGCAVGAWFAGTLADRYGRRTVQLWAAGFFRAPARYRGRLATVQQIAIISGLFFSFLSNWWLAGHAGASTAVLWWDYEAWRWMFWAELAPAFLFLGALFFIPESPRYLVARGLK